MTDLNDLEEDFRLICSIPEEWFDAAETLEVAFQLLLVEVEKANRPPFDHELGDKVTMPCFMLVGFAFEDLFKGICVANEKYGIDEKGNFTGKTHDLIKLANDAGFVLSTDEEWLLRRLQEFTVWGGRYPIPTSPKGLDQVVRPDGRRDSLLGWTNRDVPLLKNLYKRVKGNFTEILKTKGKIIARHKIRC